MDQYGYKAVLLLLCCMKIVVPFFLLLLALLLTLSARALEGYSTHFCHSVNQIVIYSTVDLEDGSPTTVINNIKLDYLSSFNVLLFKVLRLFREKAS